MAANKPTRTCCEALFMAEGYQRSAAGTQVVSEPEQQGGEGEREQGKERDEAVDSGLLNTLERKAVEPSVLFGASEDALHATALPVHHPPRLGGLRQHTALKLASLDDLMIGRAAGQL